MEPARIATILTTIGVALLMTSTVAAQLKSSDDVKKKYDGKTKLLLIVAPNNAGGQQDYFFRFADGTPEVLEKYGFIFVSPLGYSAFGGHEAGQLPRPAQVVDPLVERRKNPNRAQSNPAETARANELSEKDVMNLIALVENEFAVDT